MKKYYFPLVLLLLVYFGPSRLRAEVLRLVPAEQTVTVIGGSTGMNVILVEGSLPERRELQLIEGPGQIDFDKSLKRWYWTWQPSYTDTGKTLTVKLRDSKAPVQSSFTVNVKRFIRPWNLTTNRAGFTGIPLTVNAKQVGLDGKYAMHAYIGDELVVDTLGPEIRIKPVFMQDEKKKLRIEVHYQYPLTEKFVRLYWWEDKLRLPPLRAPGSMEIDAGDAVAFKAAMGLPPNFYIPIRSRTLKVRSNGYLDTVAFNVGNSLFEDDPFNMFAQRPAPVPDSLWRPAFDFVIYPTQKVLEITEKTGRIIPVTITDPETGVNTSFELRIFPNREATSVEEK